MTDQMPDPCPGFPDGCPNLVDVPADRSDPPRHGGGVRCGCADQPRLVTPKDLKNLTISATQVEASRITVPFDGRPMVTIHNDGRLEYAAEYQPDEAARAFWEAVQRLAPDPMVREFGAPLAARINAELAAGQEAQATVDRIRAMHKRCTERHGSGCLQCGIVWPCPTYKATAPKEG
jgi:hypothetical protein